MKLKVPNDANSDRGIDLIVADLGGVLATPTSTSARPKRAGVLSAVVKTGGQAVKYFHKIQAEHPDHLLAAWPDLRSVV